MLELRQCCKVPFPEKLSEEYEVRETAICANINASKILEMMKRFIVMHDEPLFFILELPCQEYDGITEEKTLVNTTNDYDVYFIDGLNGNQVKHMIDALGKFLIKDGMNTFGIGGHNSHEEILFGKYNVTTIYTKNAESYYDILNEFGIKKTDNLITAWDTFDNEHYGECELYVSEETGNTIYKIPEMYKEYGMYLYESRKEYDKESEKEITFDELIGKVLLVGITYYTHDNEFIEQKQFYGTVTQADNNTVCIKEKDGTEHTLPPDLSSTKRAREGEYKLRSTGEVVVNPDFFATWNVTKPKNN